MSAEADVLEELVQQSYSPDMEVRSAALKQIQELSDEALQQLLARHSRRLGSNGSWLERRTAGALPYAAFAIAIAIAVSKDPSADPRIKWIFAFIGVCIAALILGLWGYSMGSLWMQGREMSRNSAAAQGDLPFPMVVLLAGRTDGRFLPPLLSEIAFQSFLFERPKAGTNRYTSSLPLAPALGVSAGYQPVAPHEFVQCRRRYRKIVQGILTHLGPEETIELTAEEWNGLLLLLHIPEEDVAFTLCILTRLQRWGDARAVPILKRLIRDKHWYVGSEQVETAARQCLEEIETRLQREKQGRMLLRPAEGTDAGSPRVLLRPAAVSPEDAREQLLRPGDSLPPETPQ